MAPTLPVHGHDNKPSDLRKRKKPSQSELKLPEKKMKAMPHEQQIASPSPKNQKKPPPFQRTWTPNDEVRILEAMAAHRQQHGKVPIARELLPTLHGRLDTKRLTHKKLATKLRTFTCRHVRDAKNGAPTQPHERRLYDLSRNVWVGQTQAPNPSANTSEHDGLPSEGKTFDKMRDSFPNLTQAVMLLVVVDAKPADLEAALTAIDDSKAQALDLKVSKLRKELTEAIMESATIQRTEGPKMWPYASTKLRPEFEAKIENIQPEHLDEVEITQTLQAKMVVQRKLPSGETKEEIQKMMYGQKRKRNDARSHTKCNVRLPFLFLCLLAKYPYFAMVDKRRVTVHGHQEDMNKEVDKRRVAVHGHQEDMNKEGGKDVLLLSTTWPHVPVAKATLQASYGSKIVGGMPLRSECYEVFVYDVLKVEAPLLRPPGMKMAKALKSFIAWPRAQIQWCNNGDPVKPGLRSHPG
uniref:Uncharacterized protein n=1 Tax=Oryza brachyantha TaxID=4533 RepID=J3MVH4_ORYBR